MSTPGRSPKLDPYRAEIVALRRQRKTLQDIGRHLAKEHGVRVALSTLSTYLEEAVREGPAPPPGGNDVTPEQEHFLSQVEVFAELQASMRMVVERLSDVVDGVRALNNEGQQRHDAIRGALQNLKGASPPSLDLGPLQRSLAEQNGMLHRLIEERDRPSTARTSGPAALPVNAVRRIWWRALLVTGVLWAAVLAIAFTAGPAILRALSG